MLKYFALLPISLLLAGCGNTLSVKQENNGGYFADALACSQSSERTETVHLANPGAAGSIDIPLGYDAGKFKVCMIQAGRPVASIDPAKYLGSSISCLDEAYSADKSDEVYAECIRRSDLKVDVQE